MNKWNDKGIPLKRITWQGVVEGPFFSYHCSHHYRNDSDNVIEIRYKFPLPYGKSVLTGFTATLNGVTKSAKAFEKKEAENIYEDAIENGNLPVMIQVAENDFCTCEIGNLKPGEEAVITVEYLQFLTFFNKNEARVVIPTVLDDRYASNSRYSIPYLDRDEINAMVSYSCEGKLCVHGNQLKVSSPTHKLTTQFNGNIFEVSPEYSYANSDIVIDIVGLDTKGAYVAKDGDHWVGATNIFPLGLSNPDPLNISILVDCSGSMSGDRIVDAKRSLLQLTEQLNPEDRVSLFRFGSTVHEVMPHREHTQRWLRRTIPSIDADMGGTELERALDFVAQRTPGQKANDILLLITDGDVIGCESCLAVAKKTKRRFCVIGIGMAPYNNLLSELAESTGGFYEAIYDQQELQGAMKKFMHRMHLLSVENIQVNWNAPTEWQSPVQKKVMGGDSFANFVEIKNLPEKEIVVSYNCNGEKIGSTIPIVSFENSQLLKLVAQQKIRNTTDPKKIQDIALRYNLASSKTNLLLVHEQEMENPVLPELSVVPQMRVRSAMNRLSINRVACMCISDVCRDEVRMDMDPYQTGHIAFSQNAMVGAVSPKDFKLSSEQRAYIFYIAELILNIDLSDFLNSLEEDQIQNNQKDEETLRETFLTSLLVECPKSISKVLFGYCNQKAGNCSLMNCINDFYYEIGTELIEDLPDFMLEKVKKRIENKLHEILEKERLSSKTIVGF